ncbi:MAG: HAD family hydrolase [Thermodesulfobacteriota bacterium]
MIDVEVPGFGRLGIEHLVLDYNGTLAVDGRLVDGVADDLNALADRLAVHVVTADTFGKAAEALSEVRCRLEILPPGGQDVAKRDFVQALGADRTAAVGNGRNDRLMLRAAAVGIAVILAEGAAGLTLADADVVTTGIRPALALLSNPLRLVATLRS